MINSTGKPEQGPGAADIEIAEIPPLSAGQQSLLEMHSLLNVLNVLQGELMVIGLHLAVDPDTCSQSLALCGTIKDSLTDPARALPQIAGIKEAEKTILLEIETLKARYTQHASDSEMTESVANILSVFKILEVRAQEILARAKAPEQWVEYSIPDLRADFHEVFSAIEKNSHGRYRIIYNLARQKPSDYYVDFVVESANGRSISMPLLFKDVMRDLIANSRKYTAPGGSINVGVYETDTELRFVVQDTGRGIPPDEIRSVTNYGFRASNVGQVRTMGGGFGLTKAFYVTKRFGGRMWIKSELNVGTRITLTIPRPGTGCNN